MLIPLQGMGYFQQLLYSPRVLMPYLNYVPENKQTIYSITCYSQVHGYKALVLYIFHV